MQVTVDTDKLKLKALKEFMERMDDGPNCNQLENVAIGLYEKVLCIEELEDGIEDR